MAIELVDSHCHIHEAFGNVELKTLTQEKYAKAGSPAAEDMVQRAAIDGVTRLICIGTTLEDSRLAVEFAESQPLVWASIGLHPHEAKDYVREPQRLKEFAELAKRPKVVAIGECGLDYYYNHSSVADQAAILRFQLELARKHDLPLSLHVREAFGDFWPIFEEYPGLRGVLHSFSSTMADLQAALDHGLYIGLNGIMTFTKDMSQLEAVKTIPLPKLLLETDAPFLTPTPFRGKLCEPKHIRVTAEFIAALREESLEMFARQSTENAIGLFNLR